MKILLLSPPVFNPREPYLALPSLKAFLTQNGYDVIQKDINVESFNKLLSSSYLKERCRIIAKKLKELKKKKMLSSNEKKLYKSLKSAIFSVPYIIKKIDSAREFIKRENSRQSSSNLLFKNLKQFWNLMILQSGLDIVGLCHYPTTLTFTKLNIRYSVASSSDILKAVEDRQENLFIDFFEEHILPEVLSENPALAGISINDYQQIIPGFTLSKLIKDKGIYVTVGGAIFTKELKIKEEFFQLCDSFVINEGEHALLGLIKQLENGKNFHNVPNLVWFDKLNKNLVFNEISYIENLDSLPTPDFDGLPVSSYFNFFRENVRFALCVSKGCYWNKCAFCDIVHKKKYRVRKIPLIVKDIINTVNNYNIQSFYFTGESLAPDVLRELSKAIIENNLDIKWEGYARFEAEFTEEFCQLLAKAGCKKLYVGLESGSQRILGLMDKGTNITIIKKVIENLQKAGIEIHLFVLIGFPTEAKKEARDTLNFILDNKDKLDSPRFSVSISNVFYNCNSMMFKAPQNYNIKEIIISNTTDDLDSRNKYIYITPDSISTDEARKLVGIWYYLIRKKFYYFGLRFIIAREITTQNFFLKFILLLMKLIKHQLSYKINDFFNTNKRLYEYYRSF